jgi:hypothetical protein
MAMMAAAPGESPGPEQDRHHRDRCAGLISEHPGEQQQLRVSQHYQCGLLRSVEPFADRGSDHFRMCFYDAAGSAAVT